MANKDYYTILGLPSHASSDEIKSAYKKLAKQWHPDVNKSTQATEKFKEISEAYSVLSDQQKRQTYDQFGSDAVNQGFSGFGGAGGMPGFDFSDFFRESGFGGMGGFGSMEDLFRSAFGEGFASATRREQQPSHLRADIELTLEEAAFGTKKTISVTHLEECETCQGTGSSTGKKQTCNTCKGRGMETHTRRTAFGMFQTTTTCSKCGGTGQIISDPCKTCHGKGSVRKTKQIDVSIPAGVDTGNHLRISKQGNYANGKHGDLYVVIFVRPHTIFKRDNSDVLVEMPVPYYDAVLGGEIEVPLLDGKTATLNIPAGTKPGTIFRMRGKGIKHLNENGLGDEFVKVEIDVPEKLSVEERAMLEELRGSKTNKKGTKPGKKKGFFGL